MDRLDSLWETMKVFLSSQDDNVLEKADEQDKKIRFDKRYEENVIDRMIHYVNPKVKLRHFFGKWYEQYNTGKWDN